MMRYNDVILFLMVILLSIVRLKCQTITYSCNASVSCGCSTNSASLSRIVGGENAASATWGWAVSIIIANTYMCGGTIVSSSWIITAAHCVNGYTASQVTIYAGSTARLSGSQTRTGSYLIVHPSYNSQTYVNDIALLRLVSPLNMNDPGISVICLPSVSSEILAAGEWPPVDTSVVAVGWGRLSEGGSLPSTLQQVTVKTVDYRASTCTPSMADWHVQFCAGVSGGGKDTCQGDSGGPLMLFSGNNRWLLVGITSNGIGCARATDSGVYTRVAAFKAWIDSYTNVSYSNVSVSTLTSTLPTSSARSSSTRSSILTSSITTVSTALTYKVTQTTTSTVIHLDASSVKKSILNIFIAAFINFLFAFFY